MRWRAARGECSPRARSGPRSDELNAPGDRDDRRPSTRLGPARREIPPPGHCRGHHTTTPSCCNRITPDDDMQVLLQAPADLLPTIARLDGRGAGAEGPALGRAPADDDPGVGLVAGGDRAGQPLDIAHGQRPRVCDAGRRWGRHLRVAAVGYGCRQRRDDPGLVAGRRVGAVGPQFLGPAGRPLVRRRGGRRDQRHRRASEGPERRRGDAGRRHG